MEYRFHWLCARTSRFICSPVYRYPLNEFKIGSHPWVPTATFDHETKFVIMRREQLACSGSRELALDPSNTIHDSPYNLLPALVSVGVSIFFLVASTLFHWSTASTWTKKTLIGFGRHTTPATPVHAYCHVSPRRLRQCLANSPAPVLGMLSWGWGLLPLFLPLLLHFLLALMWTKYLNGFKSFPAARWHVAYDLG